MNISSPFITRPVMTTLVMLSILLFGTMAYKKLPVSDLPNVDYPTINVSANLPGASPETMAASVATPLEREFSTIAGVDSMTSTNSLGSTQITLQFNLKRDIDAAAQDVQSALSRAQRRLPEEMPTPPTFRKVNPADQPILFIALTSPTLPLQVLSEYGDTIMAQRISMVSGVAQVMVYGSQKYAVRIKLDPHALASREIGIDEVTEAIRSSNVNLPSGTLDGPKRSYTIETSGQLFRAEAYQPVIVAYRNGIPVRLGDLGEALDSVENDKTAAWYIDQRGMILAIQRQPGTNTVEVARSIKELLPYFKSFLPESVSMHVLYDRSESIKESVKDIQFTLLFSLFLVIIVIFLFLRNFLATIIPSLAMPMSIVATFAVMYLLGYSLDNLSFLALILSVGFIVDDAIVMFENIVRHQEMGERGVHAALNGSKEIGFTIVSMTLSLAAVFIPVLFMGGILGRLFREFAVTIGVAVLVSGVISLTLTPMLCSRFLKPSSMLKHSRFYITSEKIYQSVLGGYGKMLKWFLHHRLITLIFLIATLAATYALYKVIPKGFIPNEDRSHLFAFTESAEGTSWDAMKEYQKAAARIIQDDPDVEAFMSSAGSRGSSASNSGMLNIRLKPRSERELSADEIVEKLRPKLAAIPGIRVFLQNLPSIQIGGRMTKSQYSYTLQSTDLEELYRYAPVLEDKIKTLPGFRDVTTDLLIRNPQVNVDINRDKASALGISIEQIENALYSAYGSRQISTIYTPTDDYVVILELKPEYEMDPAALSLLHVRSTGGDLVPLGTVASVSPGIGPFSINHSGQLPSVTISFNLDPGFSLDEAVGTVNRTAREMLPATINGSFQGAAQVFQSSMKDLGLLLIMAILVIYIVLGILYESFIHPLTILSALPLAGLGALFTLLIFRTELNIYSFVGVILLVGLVKKNGIIMIDFAIEAQRKEGKSPIDAIYEACIIRFRPIMMTTMAALMGSLPIALGYGAGAEARQPLGLAVVGGLLFSQFLTLFVTPVFYLYMEALQRKLGRKTP